MTCKVDRKLIAGALDWYLEDHRALFMDNEYWRQIQKASDRLQSLFSQFYARELVRNYIKVATISQHIFGHPDEEALYNTFVVELRRAMCTWKRIDIVRKSSLKRPKEKEIDAIIDKHVNLKGIAEYLRRPTTKRGIAEIRKAVKSAILDYAGDIDNSPLLKEIRGRYDAEHAEYKELEELVRQIKLLIAAGKEEGVDMALELLGVDRSEEGIRKLSEMVAKHKSTEV